MSQDTETSALYQAIFDGIFSNSGSSVSCESIGLVAWERLSGEQRREALSSLLSVYVTRVHEEEHAKRLDAAAEDRTHTYLDEYDVSLLWDSAFTPANKFDEVPADINALRNVLSELELLQHRLAMRDTENTKPLP